MEAYNAALRLLLRREHSQHELTKKLDQKGFDADAIDEAVERLILDKYLSDERFAECYVRHRANAGYGPDRIANELRERGVSEGNIAHGFSVFEGDWFIMASAVRQKKFGLALPGDFKEKAKQLRFLQYRGFTQEQLIEAMKNEECGYS